MLNINQGEFQFVPLNSGGVQPHRFIVNSLRHFIKQASWV